MIDFKKDDKTIKDIKKLNTTINKVEKDCIIIFDGEWNRRIYFDKNFKKDLKEGQNIIVEYIGDLKKPFDIEFLKLK